MDFVPAYLHAIWTVMVFAGFIVVFVWACRPAHKGRFEQAARIPLDDDKVVDESLAVAPSEPAEEKTWA